MNENDKKLMALIGLEFTYEKLKRKIDRRARGHFDKAYAAIRANSVHHLTQSLKAITSLMDWLNFYEEPENEDDDEPG